MVHVEEPPVLNHAGPLPHEVPHEGSQDIDEVDGIDAGPDGHLVLIDEALVVKESDDHLFLPARLVTKPKQVKIHVVVASQEIYDPSEYCSGKIHGLLSEESWDI